MQYKCCWCEIQWLTDDVENGHLCPQCNNPGIRDDYSDAEWKSMLVH